jgi:hypothetical protein
MKVGRSIVHRALSAGVPKSVSGAPLGDAGNLGVPGDVIERPGNERLRDSR